MPIEMLNAFQNDILHVIDAFVSWKSDYFFSSYFSNSRPFMKDHDENFVSGTHFSITIVFLRIVRTSYISNIPMVQDYLVNNGILSIPLCEIGGEVPLCCVTMQQTNWKSVCAHNIPFWYGSALKFLCCCCLYVIGSVCGMHDDMRLNGWVIVWRFTTFRHCIVFEFDAKLKRQRCHNCMLNG